MFVSCSMFKSHLSSSRRQSHEEARSEVGVAIDCVAEGSVGGVEVFCARSR